MFINKANPEALLKKGMFNLYALFVAPAIIPLLRNAMDSKGDAQWAGWLIIILFFLETLGMGWLSSLWRARGGESHAAGMSMKLGSGLVISHVLLSYFLLLFAMEMFGLMADNNEFSLAGILLFTAMFFREFFFWWIVAAKREVKKEPPLFKIILGNIFVFFFQAVSFTVYWDVILRIEGVDNMPLWLWIFLAPAIVLIFMIIYLPMRAVDILEPWFMAGRPDYLKNRGRSIILNGAFLALYPFMVEYAKRIFHISHSLF